MLRRTASGPTGFSQQVIPAKCVEMAQLDKMQTNAAKLGELARSTGRDHDCVFWEQVVKALQARGYQMHRQIGLTGFFIDLVVPDVDQPSRYLLGIECDGASYHDARSARGRSELRSTSLRKCDGLPPSEFEAAVLGVVRENYGATDDQVMQAAARAIGFKATS